MCCSTTARLRQVHACTPRDPRWRDTLRWRDHILAHGIDLAAVARHGRIPARSKRALMIGFVTGYACADGVLRRHDVLPPTGGPPGTILTSPPLVRVGALALDADERLHNGSAAPVWQHYGGRTCASVAPWSGWAGQHRRARRRRGRRRGRPGRRPRGVRVAAGCLPEYASAGAGAPGPALPRRAASRSWRGGAHT